VNQPPPFPTLPRGQAARSKLLTAESQVSQLSHHPATHYFPEWIDAGDDNDLRFVLTTFGLYIISQENLFLALAVSVILVVHQAIRLSRNRIKARIDRVFRCHNEIRLANIVRQNLNQPLFDDTEMIRKTAALYAQP
jgi:hypothetical protein